MAPKTLDGRPPAHTQSSNNKCASGHGTNQQLRRAMILPGSPPLARPSAVTAIASSAGGNAFPPLVATLAFLFRAVSAARVDPSSPASSRNAMSSSRVTSAT